MIRKFVQNYCPSNFAGPQLFQVCLHPLCLVKLPQPHECGLNFRYPTHRIVCQNQFPPGLFLTSVYFLVCSFRSFSRQGNVARRTHTFFKILNLWWTVGVKWEDPELWAGWFQ